jgi:hypothetical protein
MFFSGWLLVVAGAGVGFSGGWIQLNPERIFPPQDGHWRPDAAALRQVRLLGGCFVVMGAFFAAQMALILLDQPWWLGTLSGVATATIAMALLNARTRRQRRPSSLGSALDEVQAQAKN